MGSCGSGYRQHGCDGLNFLPDDRRLQEALCSLQMYFNGVCHLSVFRAVIIFRKAVMFILNCMFSRTNADQNSSRLRHQLHRNLFGSIGEERSDISFSDI